MFQGAYSGEFYRALHDALHAEVDSWNGGTQGNELREHWDRVVRLEQTSHTPNPTKLGDSCTSNLVQIAF